MQSRDVPVALLAVATVLSAWLIFAQCSACHEVPDPRVATYAGELQVCAMSAPTEDASAGWRVYDECVRGVKARYGRLDAGADQ